MSADTQYACLECKRPLVSRRHTHCQYCGAQIPEVLLYTKAEVEAENREREMAQKARKVRAKESDEEERRKNSNGIDSASMI